MHLALSFKLIPNVTGVHGGTHPSGERVYSNLTPLSGGEKLLSGVYLYVLLSNNDATLGLIVGAIISFGLLH